MKFDGWPWNIFKNRALLLYYVKLCASFQSHRWIQTLVTARKRSIRFKIGDFLSRVTLKFEIWPWKTIGHIFYATSIVAHHFVAIGQFKLELQLGNSQFGWKLAIFVLFDHEIWRMTLKNNRAPLLSNIKLCVSFQFKLELQSVTSVTFTFCMDITSPIGNISWKFHDDTMIGT